jgi:hypothetical protein
MFCVLTNKISVIAIILLVTLILLLLATPSKAENVNEDVVSFIISEESRVRLAKMLWGEDRSDDFTPRGTMLKAAVIQCALNRLDDGQWGDTIEKVVVWSQFHGYDKDNPVKDWALDIVNVVCDGWQSEKRGENNMWRVLPSEYLFFAQHRTEHKFRTGYRTKDYWDWSLPNPWEPVGVNYPETKDFGASMGA